MLTSDTGTVRIRSSIDRWRLGREEDSTKRVTHMELVVVRESMICDWGCIHVCSRKLDDT